MKTILLVVSILIFVGCSDDKSAKSEAKKETVQKEIVKKEIVQKEIVQEETVEQKVISEPKKQQVKIVEKEEPKTGKDIFAKCIACHGQTAQKSALGKSQIIKGWDAAKITAALNGYKDGTYGGDMKAIMKGQVAGLNDENIKLVAEYISKL